MERFLPRPRRPLLDHTMLNQSRLKPKACSHDDLCRKSEQNVKAARRNFLGNILKVVKTVVENWGEADVGSAPAK